MLSGCKQGPVLGLQGFDLGVDDADVAGEGKGDLRQEVAIGIPAGACLDEGLSPDAVLQGDADVPRLDALPGAIADVGEEVTGKGPPPARDGEPEVIVRVTAERLGCDG